MKLSSLKCFKKQILYSSKTFLFEFINFDFEIQIFNCPK